MADGTTKPIKDIRVGDQVQATDPETGETRSRTVAAVWHHPDTVLELKTDNSATVTTTEDHPFWNATDHEWQQAQRLEPGDELRTPNAQPLHVIGFDRTTTYATTTYNLTARDTHTYYVVAGETSVLVHNGGGCIPALENWSSQRFRFGNETFLLDKKRLEHILTRHHPKMWDGSSKAAQSFFDPRMSVADVQDAIGQVMRQNRDALIARGANGTYQISGRSTESNMSSE